jgi:S1-C subfamily serine protease
MMRKSILVLMLVVLGLAVGLVGSGSEFDFSHLLAQISPAVVKVRVAYDPEGRNMAEASGFIVDPNGRVVTACHAVLGATQITVLLQDGSSYQATAERCTEDDLEAKMFDVALLQLPGAPAWLPQNWLGDSNSVYLGENVFLLSYPGPYGEFNVAQGQITGRLLRQYVTVGSSVFRLRLLAELIIDERGYLEDVGAVLDLESSNPSLAEISRSVRKGTFVFAFEEPGLDNPFCGLVSSVKGQEIGVVEIDCLGILSNGIVVQTGREAKLDREVEFFRSNAPISPGSSGGPLFSMSGQVIGIASWGRDVEIETDEEGFITGVRSWQGANFVVPSAALKAIVAAEQD